MGFKTGLVVGIGIGYVVATRLDPSTRERLESTVAARVSELRDDPRVKDVVGTVASMAEDALDTASDRVSS
jgi:hypothetical protein